MPGRQLSPSCDRRVAATVNSHLASGSWPESVSNNREPSWRGFSSVTSTATWQSTVIRGFITEQTANRVRVFQSSDSGNAADTPLVGRPLNQQLANALWNANGVVLVYTTPDQDWGYCMWECGLATDPTSPHTSIFVLQCTECVPSLFEGQVRINARNEISTAVRNAVPDEARVSARGARSAHGVHLERARSRASRDTAVRKPQGCAPRMAQRRLADASLHPGADVQCSIEANQRLTG